MGNVTQSLQFAGYSASVGDEQSKNTDSGSDSQ